MFEKFMPDMYQKSIYYIDYDKLWKSGIRCLLFDMDNTISPFYINKPTQRLKILFDELKDIGFKIIIISNAPKYRLEKFKNYLLVDVCPFALKPKKDKYTKIMNRFKFKNTEIAAIGDQLLTDIYGANKMNIKSILVNPLTNKDHLFSLINRIIEKIIYTGLSKKELLKKGKYYE